MYFHFSINLFILLSVTNVGKTNDSECDRNIDTVEKKFIEDFSKVSAYKNNIMVKRKKCTLVFLISFSIYSF